ncbi:uncharacterized protein [Centruroides vittatus]|uniref:uncharacterized protein n=1 Tax=Centruroides vittatus TaxID=120091 RepID=UPI00350FDC23
MNMKIIGRVGEKITLPCNITPPTEGDTVSVVLWFKENSATPIYSMDAREGDIYQAKHRAIEGFSDRINFNIKNSPATLEIKQVTLNDEGVYRCRADFKRSRTRNSVFFLKVTV